MLTHESHDWRGLVLLPTGEKHTGTEDFFSLFPFSMFPNK